SLKTSIKTITYLSDIGCLEIQGASLIPQSFNGIVHFGDDACIARHTTFFTGSSVGNTYAF
ncbi:hypothetical protein MZE12_25070, partial [Escherichia coli]|nr:hypothetical protein [Escherichia coli]MCK2418810.1 hypothetical protein [Escherichia coli]MCK2457400.1 hypothetical protein [Escherichia coli]